MHLMDFELLVFEYLDEHAEVIIDTDNMTEIGAEIRDLVDQVCSDWAMDNGLEYEGG